MQPVVVVTYPHALDLKVERLEHTSLPDQSTGLAYYYRGGLIARGVVSDEAVESIQSLVNDPVHLALAAQEDDDGNIDGRLCLVLPVELGKELMKDDDAEPEEAWKSSVPAPPAEIDSYGSQKRDTADEPEEGEQPHIALLPIGNIVRSSEARNHPDDVSADAREMLVNLLAGQGQDSVRKAIDDLLDSI
ncbi:MAG TPA: hypothetical protein VMN78_13090 [Longimicrobiales bacterium]|nr:hypothetical protein [Longimicrobiales bacterium]